MKKPLFFLLILTSYSTVFAQEIRYIDDSLLVPLRSGASSKHRIVHRGLKSGTQLSVIEQQQEYSFVKTNSGLEGWIPNQYLSRSPAAKDQLVKVLAQLEDSKARNKSLSVQVKDLTSNSTEKAQSLGRLSQESERLRTELKKIKEVSAKAIQLDIDNRDLLETNEILRTEVDVLQAENQRLVKSEKNEAFINGILAVIVGIIISLVVPRLKPRKRNSEWA